MLTYLRILKLNNKIRQNCCDFVIFLLLLICKVKELIMKGKEIRNLFLGSLILVLTISIGYFGISSAGGTYAIDAETSGTTSGNCYYCSSNALLKRYVWGSSTPSTACREGNWIIKLNRASSTECKALTCTINYKNESGSNDIGIADTTITDVGKITSEVPTKSGYTFTGWKLNRSIYSSGSTFSCESEGSYSAFAMFKECKWTTADACQKANPGYICKSTGTDGACWDVDKPSTYTISYNANGGSGAPGSQTKTHGTDLKLSSTKPTRDGYTFVNWNTNKDGTGTSYNSGGIYSTNAAVTLYVQWKANSSGGGTTTKKYTVKFDGNGGIGSMNSITCTVDSNCTLSANGFNKSGSTFKNWNTKKDGTGTSYNDKASVKNLATADGSTVTLYAIWSTNSGGGTTTKKYTVKFDSNDGDGVTKDVTCTVGSNCILTKSGFTKDGFEFKGWNTKKDGTGISYIDGATVKDLTTTGGATVTLYAKWKQIDVEVNTYKVTFKYNDNATDDLVIEVDENDTIYEILPERDGYTFDAWYTDKELTKKYDFTNKITEDITLYAKWFSSSASSPSDKTDDEITNNSKTGDIMMFIVWTVGIGTLAYSVYYFKTRKEN